MIKNIIKVIISIAITCLAVKYARLERGNNFIGGEVFTPLYCWVCLWGIPKLLKK
nr:hypothetical protein [uncultured Leptotrichia sp.]